MHADDALNLRSSVLMAEKEDRARKKCDRSYVSILCGGTSTVTRHHRYCVKAPSHRLADKPVQICDAVIDIRLRLHTLFAGNFFIERFE